MSCASLPKLSLGFMSRHQHGFHALAGDFNTVTPADPGLTLPASKPQVRLDYLFVPSPHMARVVSCEVVRSDAAAKASDHLPLLSVLRV